MIISMSILNLDIMKYHFLPETEGVMVVKEGVLFDPAEVYDEDPFPMRLEWPPDYFLVGANLVSSLFEVFLSSVAFLKDPPYLGMEVPLGVCAPFLSFYYLGSLIPPCI